MQKDKDIIFCKGRETTEKNVFFNWKIFFFQFILHTGLYGSHVPKHQLFQKLTLLFLTPAFHPKAFTST